MTALTVREGAESAVRSGYWVVTGPQPEDEVYAQIERTHVIAKGEISGLEFVWYFHRRTVSEFNRSATFMATVKEGSAGTLDEAVEYLTAHWSRLLVEEGPSAPVDPLF